MDTSNPTPAFTGTTRRISSHGLLLLAGLLASPAVMAAPTLASRVAAQDGWVGYRVPMVASAGEPCCLRWNGKDAQRSGCDLDGRHWNFGTNLDDEGRTSSDTLAVFVHVTGGKPDRIRALADSCPVRADSEIAWLEGVAPEESVAWLSAWVRDAASSKDGEGNGLAALAYHGGAEATRSMAALAEPSQPRELREQSLFWLGQARGEEGAAIVERTATRDPDEKLRAHAVFALSQARTADGYSRIKAISSSDASDHVRSQALFWMAQMGDPRAREDILARIRADRDGDVREQGVFALSQLPKGQGDDALIAVLQGDYPRETKKRAMFWLGQSGSPKAIAYFDSVLEKTEPSN